jgi:hypothetical protein
MDYAPEKPKKSDYVKKSDIKEYAVIGLIVAFMAFVVIYSLSHYNSNNVGGSASCSSSDLGC